MLITPCKQTGFRHEKVAFANGDGIRFAPARHTEEIPVTAQDI
ncbi:MAG TPA: hypothetical protein VGK56_15165 [Anaerolineales bacterium]